MSIESDLFLRHSCDFEKLIEFGFKKEKQKYFLEKLFMNGEFKASISVSKKGVVSGAVFDTENGDEYLPIRLENPQGAFVGKVKDEYINLLTQIREMCFFKNLFVAEQSNRIANFIKTKYNDSPVFMWPKFPTYGVFKNKKNDKWYGIVMYIPKTKLGEPSEEKVEVINLKINKDKIPELIKLEGIYPAWHMNKKYWISVILDETLSDDEIIKYIEESQCYTLK